MDLERSVINEGLKRSQRGLTFGFVLSAMVILGGIFLIYLGHDWAGVSLIGINLVGLAGVFVYGTNSRRTQRHERRENLAEKAEMGTESQISQNPQ